MDRRRIMTPRRAVLLTALGLGGYAFLRVALVNRSAEAAASPIHEKPAADVRISQELYTAPLSAREAAENRRPADDVHGRTLRLEPVLTAQHGRRRDVECAHLDQEVLQKRGG